MVIEVVLSACVCARCIVINGQNDNWFISAQPVPSARQHPSYGDCLSAAHLCKQFLRVQQIGFVTLGPLHCA